MTSRLSQANLGAAPWNACGGERETTRTMDSRRLPGHGGVLVRASAYLAAAWCLGFAGVSAWQVAAGPPGQEVGLEIMIVLVGVLKLAGTSIGTCPANPVTEAPANKCEP